MKTPENRLLPMSAVVAMLVVSSTIVGLAYWVGDAIAPGLASIVPVSTRSAAAAGPAGAPLRGVGTSSRQAERANSVATSPRLAGRVDEDARR